MHPEPLTYNYFTHYSYTVWINTNMLIKQSGLTANSAESSWTEDLLLTSLLLSLQHHSNSNCNDITKHTSIIVFPHSSAVKSTNLIFGINQLLQPTIFHWYSLNHCLPNNIQSQYYCFTHNLVICYVYWSIYMMKF